MVPVPSAADAVRVTVAAGSRRADLILAAGVPVIELLPELDDLLCPSPARAEGSVRRLTRLDGTPLSAQLGLVGQGVGDGDVLALVEHPEVQETPRFDDPAQAMAHVVVHELQGWPALAWRRTATAAAAAFMALVAVALWCARGSPAATEAAAATGVALLVGAHLLARPGGTTGVVAVLLASCLGALAGADLASSLPHVELGGPVVGGGAGLAAGALAAAAVTRLGRSWLLVPAMVGVLAVACGLIVGRGGVGAPMLATVLVAMAALADGLTDRVALALSRAAGGCQARASPPSDLDLDIDEVTARAMAAHRLQLALTVTIGVVVTATAPLADERGPAGAACALLSCVLLAAHTRHRWSATVVGAGLAGAVSGLVATGAAAVWLDPTWRPEVVVSGAVSALLLLRMADRAAPVTPRLERWVDLMESSAHVALVPALVIALGVLDAVTT